MPAPQISPLPTPPSRSQSPETFSTDADVFLGALPEFQTDANAQATYLDALAATVDGYADAALASQNAASSSASAAASSASAASDSEDAAATSEAAAAASAAAALASQNAAADSEDAALASEIAAAASAAEAEAIVAGVGFKDVVFINSAMSPYTIDGTTNGKLIACDTTGGNIVINLALISGLTLPFTGGVKKTTSDGNTVTINCAVGNTFDDGATSKSLSVPAGFTLIPDNDTSPDVWAAIGFGGATAGPVTGSGLTMATDKLLGRITSGTGAIEEISHASLAEMQAGTQTALRGMSPANISQAIDALAGDVSGPESATASGIALYDGTSGKLLKSGLNNGTAGQVLTSAGAGNNPTWAALPSSGPRLEAIASGTLANGSTVIVNADGTVSAVVQIFAPTPSAGSAVTFESAQTSMISSVYDAASQKVVIFYRDDPNSGYQTAVVGTVSGQTISFGTPVVVNSVYHTEASAVAYASNVQKIAVAYRNGSAQLVFRIGTVSGTSISFGTEVMVFGTNGSKITNIYDPVSQKIFVSWYDEPFSAGRSTIGTFNVDGSAISFSSDTFWGSTGINDMDAVYDVAQQKVVLAYRRSSAIMARVFTISGSSVTFGSEVTVESVNDRPALTYDVNAQKIVLAYRDGNNSNFGTARVGTVSGTTISFGSPVVFESANTFAYNLAYDADAKKVVIAYIDGGNSSFGTAVVGTISGTSISFGAPFVFEATTRSGVNMYPAYDANAKKVVIPHVNGAGGLFGVATVFTSQPVTNNLTAENFIGFSDGSYTNGQTATIQLTGAVDDAQSGLTAGQSYFVQNSGSLGLTPDTPSVFAGTAVSATKIIVKG